MNVPTITVANQKGGTGKTTLTVNLAAELARRGYDTCVLDTDPQGTAVDWARVRGVGGASRPDSAPNGAGLHVEHVGDQTPDLQYYATEADLALIDTKGQLDKRTVRACKVADLILLPTQPTAADLWPTQDLVRWIERRRDATGGAGPDAAYVIWRAKVGTRAAAEADTAAAEQGLDVLSARAHDRVAWQTAIGDGASVTELDEGSKAAGELQALTSEILDRLSNQDLHR
jgi:chromosome partitioning protein